MNCRQAFEKRSNEKYKESSSGLSREVALKTASDAEFTAGWEAAVRALGTEGRIGGLKKGAEIARYHATKLSDLPPAWVAACKDIEVSCLAAAERLSRGECEDPTSVCMERASDGLVEEAE